MRSSPRNRIAIVGTGHRATTMWGGEQLGGMTIVYGRLADGQVPQISKALGNTTMSRIVTVRGRVSMNSTASATSLGSIKAPASLARTLA